jgi:hypothetical protein
VTRLEQHGAVAFTAMAVAVVVIFVITLWGYLLCVRHVRPTKQSNE